MKKLTSLDLAFFLVESKDSPKHVAGLLLFKKPAKSPANFVRQLYKELKAFDQITEPFNLVINFTGWTGPHWEVCEDFDIDEHLFYHRPKKAIPWADVKECVAKLHEPMMDRTKPLWEFHIFDNVKGGKFAIYMKIHHAYADGMTMTSWLNQSYSESPEDMQLYPIWSRKPSKKTKVEDSSSPLFNSIRNLTGQTWSQVVATGGIAKLAAQQYLETIGMTHNAVSVPFTASRETPLTGSASPARSFATATVPMTNVKDICKATRSTLNHVALTCIDGALHRYLAAHGIVLDHPITIQMPVNLREDGDSSGGNKLGIVLVELAQPTEDPFVRLREIGFTLRNVRSQVDNLPNQSIAQYTILVASLGELIEKFKLSDTFPANGHILVSNLAGPKKPLYMLGAKLEHMFPINTLPPGNHMNITLFSYAGVLHFGLVATRDMVDLGMLSEYIEDDFRNLEAAVYDNHID